MQEHVTLAVAGVSHSSFCLQVVAGMNYKLELQTSGGNFEATVYSACHSHPSNAAVHELTCFNNLALDPPGVPAASLPCMLVAEGLGDAPHELKTYKRTDGGGDGKSGGQLGSSKELSADDEEVSLHCVAHAVRSTARVVTWSISALTCCPSVIIAAS